MLFVGISFPFEWLKDILNVENHPTLGSAMQLCTDSALLFLFCFLGRKKVARGGDLNSWPQDMFALLCSAVGSLHSFSPVLHVAAMAAGEWRVNPVTLLAGAAAVCICGWCQRARVMRLSCLPCLFIPTVHQPPASSPAPWESAGQSHREASEPGSEGAARQPSFLCYSSPGNW